VAGLNGPKLPVLDVRELIDTEEPPPEGVSTTDTKANVPVAAPVRVHVMVTEV